MRGRAILALVAVAAAPIGLAAQSPSLAITITRQLPRIQTTALLADAALCDSDGLAPADDGWTPTYDLNAATAAGWLVKAGRASILTAVDPPESGIVTSKVFDNCRAMAAIYAAKKTACVTTKAYIE